MVPLVNCETEIQVSLASWKPNISLIAMVRMKTCEAPSLQPQMKKCASTTFSIIAISSASNGCHALHLLRPAPRLVFRPRILKDMGHWKMRVYISAIIIMKMENYPNLKETTLVFLPPQRNITNISRNNIEQKHHHLWSRQYFKPIPSRKDKNRGPSFFKWGTPKQPPPTQRTAAPNERIRKIRHRP